MGTASEFKAEIVGPAALVRVSQQFMRQDVNLLYVFAVAQNLTESDRYAKSGFVLMNGNRTDGKPEWVMTRRRWLEHNKKRKGIK